MSVPLVVGPRAQRHLLEAYDFYEERQLGLGELFKAEVNDCFARILDNPKLYRRVQKNIRKARTDRFPYSVYYECTAEYVYIHLVLHD